MLLLSFKEFLEERKETFMPKQINFQISYSPNISWTLLGDEIFVFNESTDNIYVFKNVTKDLWLLIQETCEISAIISWLSSTYKHSYSDMQNKILNQIELLLKNDLILLVDKK